MNDLVHNTTQTAESAEEDTSQHSASDEQTYASTNEHTNASEAQEKQQKLEKIKSLLRVGIKAPAIAEMLNVSQGYVYKVRKELTTTPKPKNQPTQEAITTIGSVLLFGNENDGKLEPKEVAEKKVRFLQLLYDNNGQTWKTLKDADISYTTYTRWRANDPDFVEKVNDIKELQIEWVEAQLMDMIKAGSSRSAMFFLETKGKHRGYVKRTEMAGVEDAPIQIRVIKPKVDPYADVDGEVVMEADENDD